VYKATQLTVDIQPSDISINKEWSRKSISPKFLSATAKFKPIKIGLVVEDETREEVLMDISNLMSIMIGEVVLNLEGYSNIYKGTLKSVETVKTVSGGVYLLNLEFEVIEYSSDLILIANGVASKTFNIYGNTPAPTIITITPLISSPKIIINGLDNQIIVNNLYQGQSVIINCEDGFLITQNGSNKFKDWEGWDIPSISPGQRTITFSQTDCNVTIKYKPRWI
jgi:phage-related protein